MACLNYAIATCKNFYDRHDHMLKIYRDYLSGYFGLPHLLLDHDIEDGLPFACSHYRPNLWKNHLALSFPIHAWNAYLAQPKPSYGSHACKSLNDVDSFGAFLNETNIANLFPVRHLSRAEHSLLHKHYDAICLASESSQPLLVLEDDIYLANQFNFIEELKAHIKNDLSIDLGFSNLLGIQDQLGPLEFKHLRRAVTNTTCAYIIHPELAGVLMEGFFPYSLPIDFHLQYLLTKYNASGSTVISSPFINGSNAGLLNSSIQK